MRCYAILMAAGFSRRFGGQNKLLALFRGKPLARHTLDLVCGMGCFKKIFFVYADIAVAALAGGLDVITVYNPAPEKGQGESARLGLLAAEQAAASNQLAGDEHDYYMFFPCDQPLLDQDTVRLLLDAARPGYITEPVCPSGSNGCSRGHSPSLFSASFLDELLALKQGENPRLLKARHPRSVITVEIADASLLVDIDSIEDLDKLRGRI